MPSARIASPVPTVEAFPTTVDGLTVQSVGELLAARAAGKAPGGPYALKGFWSYPPFLLACIPPQVVGSPPPGPGALQLDCNDGQYGITEDNEPYLQRDAQGNVVRAPGPHLTPFVSSAADHARLFETQGPEPIVVVGKFDDALASDCQPQARQSCLDRFVIERIVVEW
jgi:hypothetical protein